MATPAALRRQLRQLQHSVVRDLAMAVLSPSLFRDSRYLPAATWLGPGEYAERCMLALKELDKDPTALREHILHQNNCSRLGARFETFVHFFFDHIATTSGLPWPKSPGARDTGPDSISQMRVTALVRGMPVYERSRILGADDEARLRAVAAEVGRALVKHEQGPALASRLAWVRSGGTRRGGRRRRDDGEAARRVEPDPPTAAGLASEASGPGGPRGSAAAALSRRVRLGSVLRLERHPEMQLRGWAGAEPLAPRDEDEGGEDDCATKGAVSDPPAVRSASGALSDLLRPQPRRSPVRNDALVVWERYRAHKASGSGSASLVAALLGHSGSVEFARPRQLHRLRSRLRRLLGDGKRTIGELDFVFRAEAPPPGQGEGRSAGPRRSMAGHLEVSVKCLLYDPGADSGPPTGEAAQSPGLLASAPGVDPTSLLAAERRRRVPAEALGSGSPDATASMHGTALAAMLAEPRLAALRLLIGPHRFETAFAKTVVARRQLGLVNVPAATSAVLSTFFSHGPAPWLSGVQASLLDPTLSAGVTGRPIDVGQSPSCGPARTQAHPEGESEDGGAQVTGASGEDDALGGGAPRLADSRFLLKGTFFFPLPSVRWPGEDEGRAYVDEPMRAPLEGTPLPRDVLSGDMQAGWWTSDAEALVRRRPSSLWMVLSKPFWLGPVVVPPEAADLRVTAAAAAAAVGDGDWGRLCYDYRMKEALSSCCLAGLSAALGGELSSEEAPGWQCGDAQEGGRTGGRAVRLARRLRWHLLDHRLRCRLSDPAVGPCGSGPPGAAELMTGGALLEALSAHQKLCRLTGRPKSRRLMVAEMVLDPSWEAAGPWVPWDVERTREAQNWSRVTDTFGELALGDDEGAVAGAAAAAAGAAAEWGLEEEEVREAVSGGAWLDVRRPGDGLVSAREAFRASGLEGDGAVAAALGLEPSPVDGSTPMPVSRLGGAPAAAGCAGAFIEHSRGFVVEDGWDLRR